MYRTELKSVQFWLFAYIWLPFAMATPFAPGKFIKHIWIRRLRKLYYLRKTYRFLYILKYIQFCLIFS